MDNLEYSNFENKRKEALASIENYTEIIFLVHPFYNSIIFIEDLLNNRDLFKKYQKEIKTFSDQDFKIWVSGFENYIQKCNLENCRRALNGLEKYPNMYLKYSDLISNLNNKSLLVIIPAYLKNNLKDGSMQKRYQNFALKAGVNLPNPDDVDNYSKHYNSANNRFNNQKQLIDWIYLAANKNLKFKEEVVKSWYEDRDKYFKNKKIKVAGEYTDLCVSQTASTAKGILEDVEILDEYCFSFKE